MAGLSAAARELSAWARLRSVECADVMVLRQALRQLEGESPDGPGEEQPVFLLGTGWRTGSTLLQRILVTDPSLLLWGEPLGRMALIPRLTRMLCCLSGEWPPDRYWVDRIERADALPVSAIANLFPPGATLRTALQAFFRIWLAEPARARGYARWGLKEVRWGPAEALLLQWLFPKATFVVITRNPLDAYRSATGFQEHWRLYAQWPDGRIDSAAGFAAHWNRLAVAWHSPPAELTTVGVRFEDLTAEGFDFRTLERQLGVRINEAQALGVKVQSTRDRGHLDWHEKLIIERVAADGLRLWRYDSP